MTNLAFPLNLHTLYSFKLQTITNMTSVLKMHVRITPVHETRFEKIKGTLRNYL